MLRVGLTGSIGMGKSTTAAMFADLGVPVHDADQTVHQLYTLPTIIASIEKAFPGTTGKRTVDRKMLGSIVLNNPAAMTRLESMIHPLVRDAETNFVEASRANGAAYVVIDIPLLFETGQSDRFDAIIVVSATEQTQHNRVLKREGMTAEKFKAIRAKQMPDDQKRARASFVVQTDDGIESARAQVAAIHQTLCKRAAEISI